MGKRLPFTKAERRAICQDFGLRPVNDWGSGDLPAPFAQGDLVELVDTTADLGRLREVPVRRLYVVAYACSIDEGDAWYFRVGCYVDGEDWGRVSDRLHVAYPERSTWEEPVDWMAPFRLVETVDPAGLELREKLLRDGWSFEAQWSKCPTCGNVTRARP